MIEEINKLKKYNTRLTTVLNELANLEDGVDCELPLITITCEEGIL